ncbi:MAG TPA: Rieske 2Fe-2S domain-containing protein [Thermoanaerobaculia bacterium]|nr:Rieske 2Fe-2S domain-containing protein [Thermoanaerobaculia bacterium]
MEERRDRPRWSEDFPIAWERDHYVTRRELAKFLTLGSALLAGASALLAVAGRVYKTEKRRRLRITSVSAVPLGGSMLFRFPTDEDPCILVRAPDGAFEAYSQVCTHLSCAVVYRAEDRTLACPCHKGVFTCSEGRPIAGPPTRRLPRIRLETRGDDLFATGVDV